MSSSSSSVPNSNPIRDQQMLAVGRQCSHQSCHLVDFLPFKCQHCANSYCADHFKPSSHTCPKYDEAKFNRVAPDCPLCNEPVPIPLGEDPNLRMERHLSRDCSVMTGRTQKASATPRCPRPKCGKLLFAPIQCDKCHQKFCPEHRFPNSHNCSSISSAVSPPRSTSIKMSSQTQASVPGLSGLAAIRRAAASVKSSTSSNTESSTIPTPTRETASSSGVLASGSGTNTSQSKKIFSKTDRSPTLVIPNAHNPTDETLTIADVPDHHSAKLAPKYPIDWNSFIPRPLFATA